MKKSLLRLIGGTLKKGKKTRGMSLRPTLMAQQLVAMAKFGQPLLTAWK